MKPSVLFIIALIITTSECAKILSIFSMPSPSHYIFASALLKELAAQGHEVTSVNTYPQKNPIKNFRDVYIDTNSRIVEDVLKQFQAEGGQGGQMPTMFQMLLQTQDLVELMCYNIFEHPAFKDLLKSPEGKFDLIIVETMYSDSLYGLGQHFNAPMIGVSTFGTTIGIDEVVGNSSPNSIVPYIQLDFSSKMTFSERVYNFYIHLQVYLAMNFRGYYRQKALFEKYFSESKLTFDEAKTNFSLLLLNQHHSLSYPRPYLPNVIEVGGLHIKNNPGVLPKDIQQFLDNATHGAIYFSMGSNLKGKDFPPVWRNMFLNVFRKLKQKVLWKFEDPDLPNKPDNVLIKPWIAQPSVLNHPNLKVFITHGGLLSTTEAIFYGKPILGIPMFYDQPRNIKLAERKGIARSINFMTMTEEILEDTILEMLNNPYYMVNAQALSSYYHDKPLSAMDEAVYWVDYVIRHKGALHLRSPAVDLNIFQYYCVDVIVFLFTLLLVIVWLCGRLIRFLIRTCTKSNKLKKH